MRLPNAEHLSRAWRIREIAPDFTVEDDPPFTPLYLTDVEYAAELSNRTVHAVLHLGWVDRGDGRYQGQMAVYVKPRGELGAAYMAFIKPFRYWLVYPALMGMIEHAWNRTATRIEGSRPEGSLTDASH